jgi:hypothetical protein
MKTATARTRTRAKYVILKHAENEIPLVFSPLLSHELVARRGNALSAGFCELDAAGRWITSGRSESLKLGARPQDAEILNKSLFI